MIRSNRQEGTAGWLWRRLMVLPLCVCLLTSCSARRQVLSVSVSETERLRELLDRKRIDASFADGTRVGGRVQEVQDGLLVVDVKESTDPSPVPLGLQSIPTDQISNAQFTQYKGYKRGLFGTLFALGGLGLGLIFAIELNENTWTKASSTAAAGTTAGLGVLGYFLGRERDKQNVTVEIQTGPLPVAGVTPPAQPAEETDSGTTGPTLQLTPDASGGP